MTRFAVQDFEVTRVGELVEVRFGVFVFTLTVEQAIEIAARINDLVPSADMILRPEKPEYLAGD